MILLLNKLILNMTHEVLPHEMYPFTEIHFAFERVIVSFLQSGQMYMFISGP